MLHRLLIPLDQIPTAQAERQLQRNLEAVPGVVVVFSNPQTEMLYLVYAEGSTERERLDQVLAQAGLFPSSVLDLPQHLAFSRPMPSA